MISFERADKEDAVNKLWADFGRKAVLLLNTEYLFC